MPRPRKCRRICAVPRISEFAPRGRANCRREMIVMPMDEYEVIRLMDLEGLTQQECAEQMHVSRTTVTAMYERARHKLADALVNGKTLSISGGDVEVCGGNREENCCHKKCCHKQCKGEE